jgi:hypothetical protein
MAEHITPQLVSYRLPWWKELMQPCSSRGEVYDDGTALLETRWRYWHPVAWFLIVRGALGFGPRETLPDEVN